MASRAHRWKGDDTPLTGVSYYDRSKKGLEFYFGIPKKARAALARRNPITPAETEARLEAARRFELLLSKLPPTPKVKAGKLADAPMSKAEARVTGQLAVRDAQRYADWERRPASEALAGRADRVRPRALRLSCIPPLVFRLARIQDFACSICGAEMRFDGPAHHPLRASIDHVVARVRGGKSLNNRLAAHRQCNSDKSDAMPTARELALLTVVNARLAEEDAEPR